MKKIVRESLFEKFTEESDPIKDMGIGMLRGKYLADAIVKKLWPELKTYDISGPKIRLKDVKEWAYQWIEANDSEFRQKWHISINQELKNPNYYFVEDFFEWWDH